MITTYRRPGQGPPGGNRRRETALDIARTNGAALEELAGLVEQLQQETARSFDLTRPQPGVAAALALRVAVMTASATLSAENRRRIAGRLRASRLFVGEEGD
jgi:hypothetical protein